MSRDMHPFFKRKKSAACILPNVREVFSWISGGMMASKPCLRASVYRYVVVPIASRWILSQWIEMYLCCSVLQCVGGGGG